MKRSEFIEEVTDFYDLSSFCADEDCPTMSDVYDSDYKDEWVEDHLVDWARSNSWTELRDILAEIPDNGEWFTISDYGEICSLSEDWDFDDYKQNALEWMDENGVWDPEEDEEEMDEEEDEDVEPDPEDLIPIEEEDVSYDDLFASSVQVLVTYKEDVACSVQAIINEDELENSLMEDDGELEELFF